MTNRASRSSFALLSAAMTAALIGCGTSQLKSSASLTTQSTGSGEKAPTVDRTRCDPTGKQLVSIDTNQDKKPDVIKLYTTGTVNGAAVQILACKQVDLNGDSKYDIVYRYDNTGTLTTEEFDLDFDGKYDSMTFYQSGQRVSEEMDTNYDGRSDLTKYFEAGKVVRIEKDSNNDGRVDQWEYYEGDRLDRIGYDSTGSGRVDKWERNPEGETNAVAAAAAGGALAPAAGATPPAAGGQLAPVAAPASAPTAPPPGPAAAPAKK